MPVPDRIAVLKPEIAAWRRDFHRNPELLYDVHRTAEIVAAKLRSFGLDEVVTGIGRTGVVGVIRGRAQGAEHGADPGADPGAEPGAEAGAGHGAVKGSGKVIGLRADMDALPIEERSNLPYRSAVPGLMHACGHDGHTAMLLGAAKYLAETRDFDGTAIVIFQPAEEGGAGGKAMVDDGMMDRFGIQQVFGMHNMPGLPIGQFALRPGPLLAAADRFDITIEGRGGHAAQPHETIDPIIVASQLVTALQTIASRNADPLASVVVSVTCLHAGSAHNIIPQTAELMGTVRTLTPELRDLAEARIRAIVDGLARAFGATATIAYERGYPVTCNHPAETSFAAAVAGKVAGDAAKVDTDIAPIMGGEDFSFMLEARPGAFILVGNGDTAGLHHPAYDFNDDAIPVGVGYWAALVEQAMPRS
jgi:amidohydrolase